MKRYVGLFTLFVFMVAVVVRPFPSFGTAFAQDDGTEPPAEPTAVEIFDGDSDGIEDALDNCPAAFNPDQLDFDLDGIGDTCDAPPPVDSDGDGVEDVLDNCQFVPNGDQWDDDLNGIGNVCDVPPTEIPAPTSPPEPTGTPVPTDIPSPTETPTPSPTPTATETPMPTATATPTLGPDDPSLYGWPAQVGGIALFAPGQFDAAFPSQPVTRLNAGGKAVTTADFTEWTPDATLSDGEAHVIPSSADVANSDNDVLFRSERRSKADEGTLTYEIPMPSEGRYRVTLGFAVPPAPDPFDPGERSERKISVNAEVGAVEITDLVLHAEHRYPEALLQDFVIDVEDGSLSLSITAVGGRASISSIAVDRITTPGEAMVEYAKQYLGYPYVWATSGPTSFDCSGFTDWVAFNVLGAHIGLNQLQQMVYGVEIPRGQLLPGDLIFFANTHSTIEGVSHVGIYIGNGQVLHASSASEGVIISDLNSGYYDAHYYTAVRLAS